MYYVIYSQKYFNISSETLYISWLIPTSMAILILCWQILKMDRQNSSCMHVTHSKVGQNSSTYVENIVHLMIILPRHPIQVILHPRPPPPPQGQFFMGAKLFIGTPWMRNEGVLKKIWFGLCVIAWFLWQPIANLRKGVCLQNYSYLSCYLS